MSLLPYKVPWSNVNYVWSTSSGCLPSSNAPLTHPGRDALHPLLLVLTHHPPLPGPARLFVLPLQPLLGGTTPKTRLPPRRNLGTLGGTTTQTRRGAGGVLRLAETRSLPSRAKRICESHVVHSFRTTQSLIVWTLKCTSVQALYRLRLDSRGRGPTAPREKQCRCMRK